MASLTIDVGRLYNTRADLQNTADAAALAAAHDLGGGDPYAAIAAASATAAEYIGKNRIWNNQPVSNFVLEFGQSSLVNNGTSVVFAAGVVPANSLRVTVYYDMQYTFAKALGISSKTVSATAVAGIGARDFMIVIDASGSMTKQSIEADVCADLDALGVPYPPPDPGAKPGKGPCVKTAKALTYDGIMGGPEFMSIFSVGDPFNPPSLSILPMRSAKSAAAFGVDVVVNAGYDDQLGTASFAAGAPWAQELTLDYDLVRTKIRGLSKFGGSDIGVGITAGHAELESVRARGGADKVMVVFADGQSDVASALAAAQWAADAGIVIHTVGLGANVDTVLLQGIADIGSGSFFYIPNNTDEAIYGPMLQQAFQSIASDLVSYSLIM